MEHDSITVTATAGKLLKPPQVAARLGVHKDTVLVWLRAGVLPGTRLPGRAGWRVSEAALAAWLAEHERGAKV